jgi:hypothetical protein
VIIRLSVSETIFDDLVRTLESVQLAVESEFLARLGVQAVVRLVSPRRVASATGPTDLAVPAGSEAPAAEELNWF